MPLNHITVRMLAIAKIKHPAFRRQPLKNASMAPPQNELAPVYRRGGLVSVHDTVLTGTSA